MPASLLAGWALGMVLPRLNARIVDAPTAILTQFLTAFGVWLAAERLHLSGVLTLVAFAATASRAVRTPARLRMPSWAVWETAIFFLNVLAFVLIGLQGSNQSSSASTPTRASATCWSAARCWRP